MKSTETQLLPTRLGHATVALLTITTEESDGVRASFDLNDDVGAYAVHRSNKKNEYPAVMRRAPSQTNVIASLMVSKVIEDFRPNYLFLIGTAGGHSQRDDLKLGDVVVADYIDYSAYWKLKEGKFLERKQACDHPSLYLRENFAEVLRRHPERWVPKLRLKRPDNSSPVVLIGGIVAGEVLLGDSNNAEQKRILDAYEKALAFEMESFGVARTVYSSRSSVHYNPQFLIIRGISDLVDKDPAENQTTRKVWTPLAIDAAATFAKALTEDLFTSEAERVDGERRMRWFHF